MAQDIIEPIAVELIEKELASSSMLRKTNKGNNEIYIADGRKVPNLMREIGRLREIAQPEVEPERIVTSTVSTSWIRLAAS